MFEGTVAEYEELMYAIDNAEKAEKEDKEAKADPVIPQEEDNSYETLWDTVPPPYETTEQLLEQEDLLNNTRS